MFIFEHMESFSLKVHNFIGKVQDYEHKGKPLDVILLIYSLYYCQRELPCMLEKFKAWLANDGIIIFVFTSDKDGLHFGL